MNNGLGRSQVREPSRQLVRLLLAFLCVGALVMILQILSGNGSEESGRFVASLAAAGVATLVYRVGRSLAAADDELSWFGNLLSAVAILALAATLLALWEAMDGEDYLLILLSLLAVTFFALAGRAGQRLMLIDHELSWIGSLTVAFAAIGLATTIAAIWGSRDDLWFENDNHLPYQLGTVSALFSIALAHTSVLLRMARSDDSQEIALIRVGTICLAWLLATSISIDVVDESAAANPKLIGVMAVLYALATVALPLMRRLSAAGIADAESIQQPAATGDEQTAPTTASIPSSPATSPTSIRPAYASDAEAIAAIYNQGIEERQATFQTRPHDPGELELKTEQLGGQLLVAERDGRVVGWAGWSGYDDRADYYAGIAECAVYVGRDARRQGVGAALLNGIADEASKFGVHKLVAKIFTTNEPSVALFRRCGFREVGTHMRHGQLDGQWKDVLVMERSLPNA